ncbi:transketolase [Chromobacterium sp. IIBBL 290-4]|uniref:transketolase n=1 Tax=Chromobacterium sp. IIBBL 290-4 TaxID=2953890 RepID=UPI0020B63CB2|nr:thiamine pyrophosphate-dependent enzyme [Chromobacterium sp. IIBBL 290-4]UTH72835.1 thiamine pyrophosphate-dependent enzyme [Chromobacterium sp. IIBBL 290-4]
MSKISISGDDLKEKSNWVWRETLRIHRHSPETRIASSLSSIDIFVALYYGGVLDFFPSTPFDENRDRCIISKGHGSICMYPILADLAYFPLSELEHVCEAGSFLGGIPDPVIPGYETINGSLGHGLGVATGVAIALKRKKSVKQTFVVCGDGELHEGANWEAIMFASHHKLDNLNLIIDNNKISMLGYTDTIISHQDLAAKFTSFGWDVDVVDGHDVCQLQLSLLALKSRKNGKPKLLIANTKKGHGVPGLENTALCHIMNPKPEVIDSLLEGGR